MLTIIVSLIHMLLNPLLCMKPETNFLHLIFKNNSKTPVNLSPSDQVEYFDKKFLAQSHLNNYFKNLQKLQKHITIENIASKSSGKNHAGLVLNLNDDECITYQCTKSSEILVCNIKNFYTTPFLKISDISGGLYPKTQHVTKGIFLKLGDVKTTPTHNLDELSGRAVVLNYDLKSSLTAASIDLTLNSNEESLEQTKQGLWAHKTNKKESLVDIILEQKNPKPMVGDILYKMKKTIETLNNQDLSDPEIASFLYMNALIFKTPCFTINEIKIEESSKGILIDKKLSLQDVWLNNF